MDAKNSPLALLAQTCSSIGADSTPNPKLLANIEKSTKSLSNSSSSASSMHGLNLSKNGGSGGGQHTSLDIDKLSPAGSSSGSSSDLPKSSFKPYEMTGSSHKTEEQPPRSASVKSVKLHRSESNQSASSQRASPATGGSGHAKRGSPSLGTSPPPRASSKDSGLSLENSSSTTGTSSSSASSATSQKPSSYGSFSGDMPKEMPQFHPLSAHHQSPFLSSGFPSSAALAASAYLNSAAVSAGYSPYAMDMAAMAHHQQQMMKAAAMSPYYSGYPMSRLKVPGMMDPQQHHPLMQMCRDPYCTGCALSNHHHRNLMGTTPTSSGKPPCPIGCTQCDHVPTSAAAVMSSAAAAASASLTTTTTNSSHSRMSAYPSVSQSSAAYAQLSALAAASQLPYVCNWIATDASYCGKRFGTSDDLLQHLRTHTSNMSESMLTTAAATGLPPTHPLLQRSYPTPPLSPLSTARYHPYGKPPSLLPPPPPGAQGYNPLAGLHPGMAAHPSLAQYFSPFSLYGMPRLGVPPSMHQ